MHIAQSARKISKSFMANVPFSFHLHSVMKRLGNWSNRFVTLARPSTKLSITTYSGSTDKSSHNIDKASNGEKLVRSKMEILCRGRKTSPHSQASSHANAVCLRTMASERELVSCQQCSCKLRKREKCGTRERTRMQRNVITAPWGFVDCQLCMKLFFLVHKSPICGEYCAKSDHVFQGRRKSKSLNISCDIFTCISGDAGKGGNRLNSIRCCNEVFTFLPTFLLQSKKRELNIEFLPVLFYRV